MPKRDDSQFWILVLMLVVITIVGTMSYDDEVALQAEVNRQRKEYSQRDGEWRQVERESADVAGWRDK